MRFLTANEIPETEKQRRKGIEESITTYQQYIDAEWAKMKPALARFVDEGKYTQEKALRAAIERRISGFRYEQEIFKRQLPPWLEYGEDNNLHQINLADERTTKLD